MIRHRAAAAAALPLLLLPAVATSQSLDDLRQKQREAVASGALRILGEPLRGHASLVVSVDLSPDGTRCVSASWDGLAKVWALDRDAPPVELAGHAGPVQFAAFFADGARVVTSAEDSVLRLFDAKSGTELKTVDLGAIHHAGAVSPDGARLASSDQRANEVEIRDLATLEVVQRVPFAGSMQTQYAWSPDGRFLVVGGSLEPKLVVWDTEAGKVVSELSPPGGVSSIAVRQDGNAVAIGGYDHIATFPFPETGTEPADDVSGMDSPVRGLAWKDPRTVIFGDDDGGIACLELDGPSIVWSVGEHRDTVQDLAMSRDGTLLASASHDQSVRFWNVADGEERHMVAGNRDMVQAIAWSADGALLAAGDYGNLVAAYDVATGAVVGRALVHENSVVAAAVADGPRVVTAAQDDTLLWLDPSDVSSAQRLALQDDDLPQMISGAFFRAETFAGVFDDGSVRLFSAGEGTEIASIGAHDGVATDAAWSADGSLLATTGTDGAIKLWRPDGSSVATLAERLEAENELCFAGSLLAAGDSNGTLRIFDTDGGRKLHEIVVATEDGEAIQELCVTPDGATLAVLTAYRVTLWSIATGALLGQSADYLSIPTFAAFSPDGTELATGMVDSTVLLWNVAKLRGE